MSHILQIEDLSHNYGDGFVFTNLSLHLQPQKLLSILGESGCGKTTFLRDIAGLLDPCKGKIDIHNTCVFSHDRAVNIHPANRGVGLVFQEYALFPALDVSQNIIFGLHNMDDTQKKHRLEELLEGMGIADIRHRFPHEISGGQQQRVALARSMAPFPKLLLLDEPFANLDKSRTQQLFFDIKKMLIEMNASAILVTHDHHDALTFSDEIAILEKETSSSPAHFSQIDHPEKIYHQPKTEKIAHMFGHCNLLEGVYGEGCLVTPFGSFMIPNPKNEDQNKNKNMLVREEDVLIEPLDIQSDFRCLKIYFLGSDYRVVCQHISGKQIVGRSPYPIHSKYVQIQFRKKEGLVMV
jgi:iron(III) transport system ATP-binding protein